MNLVSLQLDSEAQAVASEWLEDLEQDNGWFKMTVRIAAQIDTALREGGYVGAVTWYSETDFIEENIEYKGKAD